jgi:RNA polymerase sigma-70 factor (ECF subfamily)
MNIHAKNDEEKQLILDCIADKRKAQYKLFKKFFSAMMNVCLRYASDYSEAEDMLNEGFVKVFANLHKYEDRGSLEVWIKRIMANNAIDYQRKHKSLVNMVSYDEIMEIEVEKTDYNVSKAV